MQEYYSRKANLAGYEQEGVLAQQIDEDLGSLIAPAFHSLSNSRDQNTFLDLNHRSLVQ